MRDWLMKYSIRRQLAVVFSLLMMGTILLCWFINNTFLEKYYLKDKQKALMRAYQVMNSASNEDRIGSDEFDNLSYEAITFHRSLSPKRNHDKISALFPVL